MKCLWFQQHNNSSWSPTDTTTTSQQLLQNQVKTQEDVFNVSENNSFEESTARANETNTENENHPNFECVFTENPASPSFWLPSPELPTHSWFMLAIPLLNTSLQLSKVTKNTPGWISCDEVLNQEHPLFNWPVAQPVRTVYSQNIISIPSQSISALLSCSVSSQSSYNPFFVLPKLPENDSGFLADTASSSVLTIPVAQNPEQISTQDFTFPTGSIPSRFNFSQHSGIPQNSPQQMNPPAADKYAAVSDLDNLFHQISKPAATAGFTWSDTSVITSTAFQSSAAPGSVYVTAASNSFSTNTAATWSQPSPLNTQEQGHFSSTNPFQDVLQPTGFDALAPSSAFGIQVRAQNMSEFEQFEPQDNITTSYAFGVRARSSTSFGAFMSANLELGNQPNDIPTNYYGVQNVDFGLSSSASGLSETGTAPTGSQSTGTAWTFENGQQTQMNVCCRNKLGIRPQQQPPQSSVYPFSEANEATYPLKLNPGNPFL
ncbi:uncharacterized protein LOC106475592 isoform X1 [Limulus polyphemus]|uniref:Uncharacterized protein LOC106475592 isoform X1 n=1 Tax=Limulus polyphemus TaxID=6850 RepID=A0ABM1RYS0_LIMPO|nr:uncharacterized protein LOC106475592 isoform X1 [Limulus polyphemus]